MNTTALAIILTSTIVGPITAVLTVWLNKHFDKEMRQERRDDHYIIDLRSDIGVMRAEIETLKANVIEREKEIKEIRIELKNRDGEYIRLYQDHTTLKAKYENLVADHERLRKQYEETASELMILKEDMMKNEQASM